MAKLKLALTGKTVEKPKPAKKEIKLKRLKKSSNGTHRQHAQLGCYQYQKDELVSRAHARNMTVSYYLNYLLWRDWL
jgi:hypothetical protein